MINAHCILISFTLFRALDKQVETLLWVLFQTMVFISLVDD